MKEVPIMLVVFMAGILVAMAYETFSEHTVLDCKRQLELARIATHEGHEAAVRGEHGRAIIAYRQAREALEEPCEYKAK